MYFGYDICPKCKNRLFERNESKKNADDFEEYSGSRCLVCGSRLVLACVGDKKIDETIYKIIINNTTISDKEKLAEILKKLDISIPIGNCCDKNLKIFEGTADDVYIKINLLDDTEIKYTVEPKFPFTSFLYNKVCLCSRCGGETVQKMQEAKHPEGYVMKGFYCENCNEWIIYYSFSRLQLDDTIYQFVFSLEEIKKKSDCSAKEELLYDLDHFSNKEEWENKINIWGKAEIIYGILKKLKAIHVSYEITPPFLHEIGEYREFDEKLIEEILESSRKVQEQISNMADVEG